MLDRVGVAVHEADDEPNATSLFQILADVKRSEKPQQLIFPDSLRRIPAAVPPATSSIFLLRVTPFLESLGTNKQTF